MKGLSHLAGPGLLLAVIAGSSTASAEALQCISGDLGLPAALSQARQSNPDVVQARDAVAVATGAIAVAGERPNPTLNLLANQYDPRRSTRQGGVYHTPVFASAGIQQLIERGGKRDARLGAARASADAARADLADALRHANDDVYSAYFDLKLADARVEALRDIAALQHDTLAAADHRLRAGDISPADRSRIELEVLKADNDLQSGQTDALKARIALSGLLGCVVPDVLTAVDPWPTGGWNAQTSTSLRADEVAAQSRLAAADAGLQLARAQQHRDVTVGIEYDHDPRVAPNMAGISVSVPLFLAHHYEGEVTQARAERDAAASAADQVKRLAAAERAATAQALSAAAVRRDRTLQAVLPQAEKAAEAVEYAYAHGAAPLLDLLDARRALRAARLDALAAQNDFAHALADRDAAITAYSAASALTADASGNIP